MVVALSSSSTPFNLLLLFLFFIFQIFNGWKCCLGDSFPGVDRSLQESLRFCFGEKYLIIGLLKQHYVM